MKEKAKKALQLIINELANVKRFRGNDSLTKENSVLDHINGLKVLINEEVENPDLRDRFLVWAELHDAGEIAGEIGTISNNRFDPHLKHKYEYLTFCAFAHLALLAVSDKKMLRIQAPLEAFRHLVNQLFEIKDELPVSLDGLVDYLELNLKHMMKHSDAFPLITLYERAVADNWDNRIFKLLDMIEGNEFLCANFKKSETPLDPDTYHAIVIAAIEKARSGCPEEHLALTEKLSARLLRSCDNYRRLINAN